MTDKQKTRIALWRNAPGENKPVLKGTIEYPDGSKQNVSLWANDNKAKKNAPTYTGEIDDAQPRS